MLRAIILAGGFAKRMGKLAAQLPKSLLPIAGKPAIDYILDRLDEIAPKKILLTTNVKFRPAFESWLASKRLMNVELVVEHSTSEKEKPGAVGALARLVPRLEPDDYVVICGDNIFTSSLTDMLRYYRERRKPVVALYRQNSLEEVMSGSAVTLDNDNRISRFEEKPKKATTTIVGACVYILPYRSLLKSREYLHAGGNRDEPGHFIAWLCKQEDVYGYMLASYVWDIGTPKGYEKLQQQFRA
ncbi:MAG TPA: nucleotidyltransferase family protein [Candidatus Acidoferrum sp.]|nr:nucleotidyltransferase family protein [Candidatus Acidoferrum sp.]